ncbi:hypothetical protein ACFX2I_002309 [Malus domestica]
MWRRSCGHEMYYGVPLHLIRELYETFRNFKIRIADYIRYRKLTSNMNDRFPDATHEELNASDATCIICREEIQQPRNYYVDTFFMCLAFDNGTGTTSQDGGVAGDRVSQYEARLRAAATAASIY